MRSGVKSGLLLALGLAVGLAAGAWFGFRFGTSFILDNAVYSDAQEIRTLVASLKGLRAGDKAEALELLEARLDDQLVVLDPQEPYNVTPRTAAFVEQAIKDAKAYRSSFPRTSKRASVDKMVESLFSRH